MAEQSENNQDSTGIEYAGKHKWGYDVDQVNDFLDRAHQLYDRNDGELTQQDIQSAAFTFTKGGYVIAEVDAALARLEHAVVDKETARQIAGNGNVAWQARTQQLYNMVSNHARRRDEERFMRGARKRPSYDIKQVDRLIDQIVTKVSDELGVESMSRDDAKDLADLNSSSVANVIFTQRKGDRGYDERQVDYYLDACVQLLSRIESYARISDYNQKNGYAAAQPMTVPVAVPQSAQPAGAAAGTVPVSPLIDDGVATSLSNSAIPTSVPPAPAFEPANTAASSTSFDPFGQSAQQQPTTQANVASSSSFDFNTMASGATAPVIPDMPAGSGASSSVSSPIQNATTGTDTSSSLAALANMANATQGYVSQSETEVFTPQVPAFNTQTSQNTGNQSNDNSGFTSPLASGNADTDIPDISFPDFGSAIGTDQKNGE